MSPAITRPTKNQQFEHAAAAMGAFWERARRMEARHSRSARPMRVAANRTVARPASHASPANDAGR